MELDLKNKYSSIMKEIRDRILTAEILSDNVDSIVFIESTSLQIRKILELIAYLTLLVNVDKVDKKYKEGYHAKRIIEAISKKTTVFYPFPSRMIPANNEMSQPLLIPIGYKYALSQDEFKKAYVNCGDIMHAHNPFTTQDKLKIDDFALENKVLLKKLKQLLANHTVGVQHVANKYTFLHTTIDFTNDHNTKLSTIIEYKTQIFSEEELIKLFQ